MSDAPSRLDQDLPESALDMRRCAEVGVLLAAARAGRSLSVEDVARRLLLSKRQVEALERSEPRVFHAPAYFVKALRKYGAFLEIAPHLTDGITADAPDENEPRGDASPRRWGVALLLILALVIVALVGTWLLRTAGAGGPTAAPPEPVTLAPLPPSVPATVPPRVPEPETEEPEIEKPAASAPPERATPAAGRLDVARSTWVFVRYPDNSTVERSVAAGERIDFRAMPVYVAVGTATGVTLVLGDRPVDVSPFIRDGQVRITRDQILALARPR